MLSLNKQQQLFVGIVFSMLMWGVSWPSAKVLSSYAPPLEIAFMRFAVTFLGVFVLLKSMKVPLGISTKGLPPLTLASAFMAFYSMLFFSGIKHGMPGAGGVLVTTTSPLVAFIYGSVIAKRKLSQKEIIGLCLGLLAGCFLLQVWSNDVQLLKSGNLFFLASTLVWTILSRFTAKSNQYGSALAFSLWMYLLCVFWLLFFVDLQHILVVLKQGDFKFYGNLLFNGVLNTGVATTIFFLATSKLGAEKTSSFIYIVPFAASISSFLFLNEKIQWFTIVGGLLGLVAVWVINSKRKPLKSN
ncbi:MAG: DMT family transporter [Chitinophagaceae bacterium]|nr:DMT family transporter [Chitinophagaceae bacterium]